VATLGVAGVAYADTGNGHGIAVKNHHLTSG
jgi:hypothetical protein